MLKLFVTLVLLGAFLGQSKGDVGDACYDCSWDSTGDASDPDKCGTISAGTTAEVQADSAKPYCYTSVVGTITTRGITSLNSNVCGADDALVTLTFSTCSGALCNDDAAAGFSPTVEACEVPTTDCSACPDTSVCPDTPDTPDTPDCSACQDSNSGTKANRGFGVIMTSVSLSYVITKFL